VAAGREEEKRFLQYAQRMIRENFVLHLQQPTLNYMSQQEQAFAQKFSQFINERNILDMMNELALAEAQIEQNGNGKIILLDLSIKLYRLLKK
jgi:DNA polymerase-3 subunit delta'